MENKQLNRGAGVLMPISSLPSSYGIGTIGAAAYSFVDMLVDLKQRYWQILPIGPTNFGNSPYQPVSAFAGNNYLIDLDALVADGLLTLDEIRSVNWGNNDEDIDYASMYTNRTKILRIAFSRFDITSNAYEEFVQNNHYWLDDYALFRALKKYHNDKEWTLWENCYKNREPKALEAISQELAESIEFYKFCQFEFFFQWQKLLSYANQKGLSIIGDIPFYVAHDSSDVWAHKELFQLLSDGTPRLVSAVPPDAFSSTGQIWGSPVYDWNEMELQGFDWWKSRFAMASKLFNVIRLDHFIAIVKYFAVNPASSSSIAGRWYKGMGKKFIDAIVPALGDAQAIIDDAGPKTIVPGVKKLTKKIGYPTCKILLLGLISDTYNDNLPHNFSMGNTILYTTNHDTETLKGYLTEHSESEMRFLYDYMASENKAELADMIIRLAYGSCADVVIVPMQDLLELGNEARMNAPSTIGGNWQWRISQHTLSKERSDWIRKLAYTYRR